MKTVIYGLQYGDEGKGKVASYFGKDYDWSVRFNGGPNAGHTVYHNNVKYALHHLPAGILSGHKVALDAGMVIDLMILEKELAKLPVKPQLYISGDAHIIQECHKDYDQHGSGVGSTKKGISYAYADKILRKGLRVKDKKALDQLDDMIKKYDITIYEGTAPFGKDDNVLFESAQGVMLDVDYGCYPYVTSSSVMPNGYYKIDKRIGVMKAYTSRVGDGPPYRDQIQFLTDKGTEFGTTTGRPRKCYWNDIKELRYAVDISRPDEMVVTKLDILDGETIDFCMEGTNIFFNTTGDYLQYLIECFPQICWYSDTPLPQMKTCGTRR